MDYYTTHAQRLAQQYDSLSSDQVHADWLKYLPSIQPNQTRQALDLGAGSGRDAAWLASKGWDVLAIEPSQGLSGLGKVATAGQSVRWLDDTLPQLDSVPTHSNGSFNLILASAMWMHLTAEEQAASLFRLKQLASPGAVIVITWRNQANERERVFHEVDEMQFELSDDFKQIGTYTTGDTGGRDAVVWRCVVLARVADQ